MIGEFYWRCSLCPSSYCTVWQYTSQYTNTGIISHHNIYHFLLTKYIWPDESLCWGKHCQSHHKTVEDLGIAFQGKFTTIELKCSTVPRGSGKKKINTKNSVLQTQLWNRCTQWLKYPETHELWQIALPFFHIHHPWYLTLITPVASYWWMCGTTGQR